jgi:HAD superfamily hydrolase (TIGR01484 family)
MQWIIMDIDGCISPEESIPWDLERFAELAYLSREASAGRGTLPPFTLCTGRPQPYVEVLMKMLDVRAPAICENGAVLYTLHNNLSQYAPGVSQGKIEGLRAVRAFIEHEVLPSNPKLCYQFGKEAQISVFSEQPDVFSGIKSSIEDFIAERGGPELLISPSHYYLNISLAGVDKGSTLKHLLGELGVSRKHAAGIGDTEGDLPLRDNVGFFACPANATPDIRAVADYVSPHANIAGVLDILRRPELQQLHP